MFVSSACKFSVKFEDLTFETLLKEHNILFLFLVTSKFLPCTKKVFWFNKFIK